MMNKQIELNIFIENEYDSFFEKNNINLEIKEIIEKAQKMTYFFLSNDCWVKKSCLEEYKDTKQIYFDVVFCDNEKIHEINRDYREKDRPTDVITFAIFADSPKEERFVFDNEINLGEIIISLDKTLEQSKENKHSFEKELYFLLAHGILHLLGYDHMTEETLIEMWDMQKEMMGKINV